MAKQYYSVITDYGTQVIASAIARKQPLQITQMAVGDGNGRATTPNSRNTGLVREVHRANISAISVDSRNNKQIIFELTIPENVGGFWIREMGIFDNQNRLVAYANCPDSFKPQLESGSGKVQVVRMILLVSSSDAITLKVDDSVIFVTREQLTPKKITATSKNAVDETGHSHEIDKASTTQAGIVQLTNDLNSEAENIGLTAKAGKMLFDETKKAMLDASDNSQQYTAGNIALGARSQVYRVNNASAFGAYNWGVGLALRTGTGNTGFADLYLPHTNNKTPELWIRNGYDGGSYSKWGKLQPLPPITSEVNDPSQDKLASALGVKKAFDRAIEAERKGLPVGAVIAFPSAVQNPQGFLKCDGSTFSAELYPDLYRVLGSNQLPDLNNQIGMIAPFATDNLPAGWVWYDDISSAISQESYPVLYHYLTSQYGSLDNVPRIEDRFIRGAGNGLMIGQKQDSTLKNHKHGVGKFIANDDIYFIMGNWTGEGTIPAERVGAATGDTNNRKYRNLAINGRDPVTFNNGQPSPIVTTTQDELNDNSESRPKAIAFKYAIKATHESLMWIKAYGAVTNAGELDASRLAQDLQGKANLTHTHTYSQILDFEQGVLRYLTQGFTQNFAENGWCKLPNGLLIQWGKFKAGWEHTTQRRVTFPIAFPNDVFFVGLTEFTNSWSHATTVQTRDSMNLTGFDVVSQRNDSMFLALGY